MTSAKRLITWIDAAKSLHRSGEIGEIDVAEQHEHQQRQRDRRQEVGDHALAVTHEEILVPGSPSQPSLRIASKLMP